MISFPQDEALNNVTKSVLNFVPTTDDDGKSITCRAENPKVSGLFLETTWKIEVICEYIVNFKKSIHLCMSAICVREGYCCLELTTIGRKEATIHLLYVISHFRRVAFIIKKNICGFNESFAVTITAQSACLKHKCH